DAALLLISGGGSALAEAPHADLSLEDVRAVNEALLNSGAPIEEMNCVRAHLSRLKGGGLARALHARGVTRARALVAVDVPIGGGAGDGAGVRLRQRGAGGSRPPERAARRPRPAPGAAHGAQPARRRRSRFSRRRHRWPGWTDGRRRRDGRWLHLGGGGAPRT